MDGIQTHQYGAHIFHTSNKEVWDYVNQFATFNRYTNSPVANYKGTMYNLPFNMNTFNKMWGVRTPQEAVDKINEQRQEMAGKTPQNLEEQAISLIGRDIYEKLVKGYTEKHWGQKATELPAFIIRRSSPKSSTWSSKLRSSPKCWCKLNSANLSFHKLKHTGFF